MNRELQQAVSTFGREIQAIFARAVREEVREALGRFKASSADVRGALMRASVPRLRRRKRSPRQLDNAARKLQEYIAGHPNQRMEQISRGIGIRTPLLQPLIRRLLEEKRIKAKGRARGTTYTVAAR